MIGTSFLRVAAHDDDFGTNAAITYSMSSEQPEYLRVNPLTGWVYVNQPISQVHNVLNLKHAKFKECRSLCCFNVPGKYEKLLICLTLHQIFTQSDYA